MNRRTLLRIILAAPLALALHPVLAIARTKDEIAEMQARWANFLPKGFVPPDPAQKLIQTEDKWREQLAPDSYAILREEATERPGSSPLNDEKRPGVFLCRGCDLPLFSSEFKYDSGTGWPSFFTSIPGSLETKRDFRMVWPRTEYHCSRCGGHQGHIFDDGPRPTKERWCNNGLALRFLPADAS